MDQVNPPTREEYNSAGQAVGLTQADIRGGSLRDCCGYCLSKCSLAYKQHLFCKRYLCVNTTRGSM